MRITSEFRSRKTTPAKKGKQRNKDHNAGGTALPVAVTRTYSLRLHGDQSSMGALWETHRLLNTGAGIFCDWLLTLGGGLTHARVAAGGRFLTALAWLSVESQIDGPYSSVPHAETLNRLEEILQKRDISRAEISHWVDSCGPALTAEIRADAVWIDRSQTFDDLCRELNLSDLEKARDDAGVVWKHLFGQAVLLGEEGGADPRASGAGLRSAHLFSHLLGDAPGGFGKLEDGGRRKLYYHKQWGAYLAGRLLHEAGITFRTRKEVALSRKETGEAERSAMPFMREMLFRASERMAAYRTLSWQREVERSELRGNDAGLQRLETDPETSIVCRILDELRAQRAKETGALRAYVFSDRALAGWEDLVTAWLECKTADERRRVVAQVQSEAQNGRAGDVTLFSILASDDFTPVWRDRGGSVRPDLLRTYAAGWAARRDTQQLGVIPFRHPDPCSHPIFERFGVSRPSVYFDLRAGSGGPPQVTLVLWDGRVIRPHLFTAASRRVERELLSTGDHECSTATPSRRTRLAQHALSCALEERGVSGVEKTEEHEWVAFDQILGDNTASSLFADRDSLKALQGGNRFIAWQLLLAIDLKPQGPWTEYIKKIQGRIIPDTHRGHLKTSALTLKAARWRGLSYPFQRSDFMTGRGGELTGLAGVRVLGVDLRQRYGAACALWESISAEQFTRLTSLARQTDRRVEIHPLWAHIEGAGLFRRTADDQSPAPWAQLISQTIIKLPGEEHGSVRTINRDERVLLREVATILDLPIPADNAAFDETVGAFLRSTRTLLRTQASMATLVTQLEAGNSEGGWEKQLFGSGLNPEQIDCSRESAGQTVRARWEQRDVDARRCIHLLNKILRGSEWSLHAPNKGGLSLRRIGALEELRRLQKSYHGRPSPDRPDGTPVPANFSAQLKRKISRLKRERSRDLAARIAACALGEDKHGERRFPHAHAVIIEDLRGYRAGVKRSRRTNRQLGDWNVAGVRDALTESCQIHGIHLREVASGYSSMQDAKTGKPGLLCHEMTERNFVASSYWRQECERAAARKNTSRETARDRLLCGLRAAITEKGDGGTCTVLLPAETGRLIVTLGDAGQVQKRQVGLNAAANIGLASLLDPHYPASRWRIPATWSRSDEAYVAASASDILLKAWRFTPAATADEEREMGFARSVLGEKVIYLWRDPTELELSSGEWEPTRDYWSRHESLICAVLANWRG